MKSQSDFVEGFIVGLGDTYKRANKLHDNYHAKFKDYFLKAGLSENEADIVADKLTKCIAIKGLA